MTRLLFGQHWTRLSGRHGGHEVRYFFKLQRWKHESHCDGWTRIQTTRCASGSSAGRRTRRVTELYWVCYITIRSTREDCRGCIRIFQKRQAKYTKHSFPIYPKNKQKQLFTEIKRVDLSQIQTHSKPFSKKHASHRTLIMTHRGWVIFNIWEFKGISFKNAQVQKINRAQKYIRQVI